MKEWDFQEYVDSQIEKIKRLKDNGYTDRAILNCNGFCFEAVNACGLPLTYLVPKLDGREMAAEE